MVVVLSSSADQVGFKIERYGDEIELPYDPSDLSKYGPAKVNRFVEKRVVFETYYEQIDGLVNLIVTRGFGNTRITTAHLREVFEVHVDNTLVRKWDLYMDPHCKNEYQNLIREIYSALTEGRTCTCTNGCKSVTCDKL